MQKKGLSTEYRRPKYLSGDRSNIIDAVNHALKWLKVKNNYEPEAVLLLQPTSPFRKLKELKKAIYKFKTKKIDSMVGAASMTEHPTECLELEKIPGVFLKK